MRRWLDELARHGPYNNLAEAEWSNRPVEALDALQVPNGTSKPDGEESDNRKH